MTLHNLFTSNFDMKKFLCKILSFTLLVIVCAFGLDLFLSDQLRINKNRIYATWSQLYNDSTSYDIVINGNSRAWRQYNPLIIDSILGVNSFNLGIDGSGINRQIIKYNKYCELHEYPKYVIQNIDLFTMSITYGYEREQFFPYFYTDRSLMKMYDKYEMFSFAEKYIPYYRYLISNIRIDSILIDNQIASNENYIRGYLGSNECYSSVALDSIFQYECKCDTTALNMLVDFLQDEINKGVKIIFVYAPIYYEARQKMVNEQQMFEMYDGIAKKFDIPILDYNDIPMCYDKTYFYNATHLNKRGAELFTTKLAHDIDSIWCFNKDVN